MVKKALSIRTRRVIKDLDLVKSVGLELGPLTAPVITKDQGNIFYLDHLSLEELRKKYKKEPIDPNDIVAPDFILKGTLKNSVKGKKFDYIVASHVIEHIPDTISWLNDLSSVLKPGGVIKLVVPDKRFTFDLLRKDTVAGEVVGSYLSKLEKPSASMIYDYAVNYAKDIDPPSIWKDRDYYKKRPPVLRWNKKEVMEMCRINAMKDGYIDCHCHVYTPESFIEIFRELTEQKLIDFEIIQFLETQPNELEFYVTLKKTKITDSNVGSILKNLPKNKNYDNEEAKRKILEDENKELRHEIKDLTESSSWKITQPLRSVNKLRKKLK